MATGEPDRKDELRFGILNGGLSGSTTPGGFRVNYLLDPLTSQNPTNSKGLLSFTAEVLDDMQDLYGELAKAERAPHHAPQEVTEVAAVLQAQPPPPERPQSAKLSSDFATVLVILKSFVGGTMVVMPATFLNTGLLNANLIFTGMGLSELWCMVKLIEAHRATGLGFSTLAEKAMGRFGSAIVEVSLVVSQIGFVASEMIYVAKNGGPALRQSLQWEPGMSWEVALLWLQLLFAIPMTWCRDLTSFTSLNCFGNLLVLFAIVALSATTIVGLSRHGMADSLPLTCPPQQALVFMGFSVYAFEGINMVIPMYTAHKNKDSFTCVLTGCIVFTIILFCVFASANAVLYGSNLKPILTMNLPHDSMLGFWLMPTYSLASMVLVPLMAFPIYEILEGRMRHIRVGRGGKLLSSESGVNIFRALLMVGCTVVAQCGGSNLDTFLALVGAWGCIPLAYVYPALIHNCTVAKTWGSKLGNYAMVICGICVAITCTVSAFGPSSDS